jgi:hypothetical protein
MMGSAFGAALPTVSVVCADAIEGKAIDPSTMASAVTNGTRNGFLAMTFLPVGSLRRLF